MFSLNQAITDWRRQMVDGGINASAVLDELEGHLREDFEKQMQPGSNAQAIFEAAVQQVGPAGVLEREFKIAGNSNERKYMKRVLIISAGVLGVLVGMGLVMPAVAQYQQQGAMTNAEVGLLLGVVLTLSGAGGALLGVKKRSA
jgi:hypothetical protein